MTEITKTGINVTGATIAKEAAVIAVVSREQLVINLEEARVERGEEWIGADEAVVNSAELKEALIVLIMLLEVKLKRKIKGAIASFMLY